jgi:hypothetical protein
LARRTAALGRKIVTAAEENSRSRHDAVSARRGLALGAALGRALARYGWVREPVIVGAPMARLAASASARAG